MTSRTPADQAGVVLRTSHTHLFPGIRLLPDDPFALSGPREALVVFSDATAASATLTPADLGSVTLDVDARTTSGGTLITHRRWHCETVGGEFAHEIAQLVARCRLPA